MIVEADYGDFVVEPSFGTHFFQNLITFQIGYLTINSQSKNNFLDWDWLNSIEAVSETEYVRHVRLKRPLNILIDGRSGKAVVFKTWNRLQVVRKNRVKTPEKYAERGFTL